MFSMPFINTYNCKIVTKKSQHLFRIFAILQKSGIFVKYFLSSGCEKRVFRRFCGCIGINYSVTDVFCQIIFWRCI